MQRAIGRLDGSRQSSERAVAIYRELADANPSDTRFRYKLANTSYNLGNLLRMTRRPTEALRSYERSRESYQQVADANPFDTRAVSGLGARYYNIGELQRETGRPVEALRSFERAREIFQRLADDNLTTSDYQVRLSQCHFEIGLLLQSTGRMDEARRSLEKCLDILDKSEHPSADDLYNKACLLARISALSGPGGGDGATVDRAMQTLREAIASGFRNRDHMAKDGDLDPLRSRPDFQLLMIDLAFPADPFAR
jgi:tetratricopeptide (TPR) repeat protein